MCFSLKVPLSLNNELKQADLTCSLHDASAVLIVTVWRILSLHFLYLKLVLYFSLRLCLVMYQWWMECRDSFFTFLLVVMPAFVALPGSWLKLRFKSLLWISIFFFGKTRFSQFNRGLAIKIKPTQRIIKTWSVTKGLSSLLESVHLSSIMKIKIEMIRHLF